jgi:hypothetical protein
MSNRMKRSSLLVLVVVVASLLAAFGQAARLQNVDAVGPRPLEKQTADKVSHYYLEAWKDMRTAFAENRPQALDASFVGIAREKLGDAIREQQTLGIKTRYQDRGHDLKFVFYSSEGLSIQVLDTVDYDLEVLDHDQVIATRHMRTRYVAVLTPTEVRWKVRLFQADF